jgi:hypothetical protein
VNLEKVNKDSVQPSRRSKIDSGLRKSVNSNISSHQVLEDRNKLNNMANSQVLNQIKKPKNQHPVRESKYRLPQPKNLITNRTSVEGIIKMPKVLSSKQASNMESLFKKKKFGDDMLAELSFARFHEAKKRLRHFVINTDMQSDMQERQKLLDYFKHRQNTLVMLLKDCYKARKANGGMHVSSNEGKVMCEETQKIFKLVNKKKEQENLS